MGNLISRTVRLNLEEYDEGHLISGRIYDTGNMSQYVRDAIREKNERELEKLAIKDEARKEANRKKLKAHKDYKRRKKSKKNK